jgi:hypothetical protein
VSVSIEFQNTLDHAWRLQDYAYGRELIEKALLRDPKDTYLRICHITALAYCSSFQSARDETTRLFASLSRNDRTKWSQELAAIWVQVGRHDLALPLALEAGQASDASVGLLEITATCLEQLRRLDEAEDVLARGLRRHPGHAGLLWVKSRVLRQRNRHGEAARALQSIMPSQLAADEVKVRIGYELGQIREAQGLYGQAYQEFSKVKLIQMRLHRELTAKWAKHTDTVENLARLPTREDFSRWKNEDTPPHPRLSFLTGCPRSGTTLLERMLDSHDEVAATPETLTFTAEIWTPLSYELSTRCAPTSDLRETLQALTRQEIHDARRRYERLVPDALEEPVNGRMIVDKNPSLFDILPTVARLFPQSPLLVALRDPRAIAWSCFTQYLPANLESVAFFNLESTCRHIAARLQQWVELRNRLSNPWHEVRYEALVRDPKMVSRKALEFLGLPWSERVLHYHEEGNYVRSPSYAQASRPIYQESVEKWRHYEDVMERHLPALKSSMKELDYE